MNLSRGRLIPGILLITLGLVFLFGQYFEFAPPFFILVLGLLFLLAFILTKSFGFLIPACILSGLGAGLLFARPPLREDAAVSLGLGIGFIAIYVIQRLAAGRAHWWPLVPGLLLLLTGFAETFPEGRLLVERGWPFALILLGLLILASQFRTTREKQIKL